MKPKKRSGHRGIPLVAISEPQLIGRGFRSYERFSVQLADRSRRPSAFERDVLRCGPVVGVLAVDPVLDYVVLIRQFRLGAYLAIGEHSTLEIVAGQVDVGEDVESAARRECFEEIGIEPKQMVAVMELTPAPAWSDEVMTLFLAEVDSRHLPARAGISHEQEDIETVRCEMKEALALLANRAVHNAPTIIALQWLTANRDLLPTLLNP